MKDMPVFIQDSVLVLSSATDSDALVTFLQDGWVKTPTRRQYEEWRAWVASRPPRVREVAQRFDPWTLFTLRSTNHRVLVTGFAEGPVGVPVAEQSVSLRVFVSAEFNDVSFERLVFGIDPDELAPCVDTRRQDADLTAVVRFLQTDPAYWPPCSRAPRRSGSRCSRRRRSRWRTSCASAPW